ncbi:MAG: Fur family transcriptional regulator [Solirubrobacterales bacterium]
MAANAEEIAERLRSHGLRATRPRVRVYAAVSSLPGHPEVREIIECLEAKGDLVSTQAVYDSLQALTAAGLVRRIEPAGSAARFETRVGDNHHHIVCRACGVTQDVDCAVSAAPCLSPDGAAGFLVDEAEITFWGVCPDCRAAIATESAAATNPTLSQSQEESQR